MVDGFILRLPCQRSANFSIVRQDVALQGSVIETFMFSEISECQSHCIFNEGCKSINYQDNGENICELNNITTEDMRYKIKLTPRRGWKYMTTDHNYTLVFIFLDIFCNIHCISGIDIFLLHCIALHCVVTI